MTTSGYQGDRSTSWFGTVYYSMCNSRITVKFCYLSCCLYIFFVFRAFATISAIQQSYYEAGIETGLLATDTEARFSVQAYAISVADECANNTNVCKEAGKDVLSNSTENGDIAWVCLTVVFVITHLTLFQFVVILASLSGQYVGSCVS